MITGRYKHFKGKEYKILCTALGSDSLAPSVIYQGLYHSPDLGVHPIFSRPLSEFNDQIARPEFAGERFTKLSGGGPYVCRDCNQEI
jgi:hypothetical protein